jgi:hypothetical protein
LRGIVRPGALSEAAAAATVGVWIALGTGILRTALCTGSAAARRAVFRRILTATAEQAGEQPAVRASAARQSGQHADDRQYENGSFHVRRFLMLK